MVFLEKLGVLELSEFEKELALPVLKMGMELLFYQCHDASGLDDLPFPLEQLMDVIANPNVASAPHLAAMLCQTLVEHESRHILLSMCPHFFDSLAKSDRYTKAPLLHNILRNMHDCVTPNMPSVKFWSCGLLDVADDISANLNHQPFCITFPRAPAYRSLYSYRILGAPSADIPPNQKNGKLDLPGEIIVVWDMPNRDEYIRSLLNDLKARPDMDPPADQLMPRPNSEKEIARRLKQVAFTVHCSIPHPPKDFDWDSHFAELQAEHKSYVVSLGSLRVGYPRHRALLFKYLCDGLKLPCQLCRWPDTDGMHIFNVAFEGLGGWVVDFASNRPAGGPLLLAEHSLAANEYIAPPHGHPRRWLASWKPGEETLIAPIGQGAFGTVDSVSIALPSGETHIIARKTLKPGKRGVIRSIWLEAQALRFLSHPNLLEFYCAAIDFELAHATFYTEICQCSLSGYLKKTELCNTICTAEWLWQMLGIISALSYMHAHSYVHRDIKPGNILLKLDLQTHAIINMKIADFGLARNFQLSHIASAAGTPGWRPPEVVNKQSQKSGTADVYAFGLLVALVLINKGSSPWGSLRDPHLDGTFILKPNADSIPFNYVVAALGVGGSLYHQIPPSLRTFVSRCITTNLQERYSSHAAVAALQVILAELSKDFKKL